MEASLHLFYIHGLFHITDLDFYRSNAVAHWPEDIIRDCFYCCEPDDQIAMTVPASLLTPNRSLDLRSNNIRLDVFRDTMLDGKEMVDPPVFVKYYNKVLQH